MSGKSATVPGVAASSPAIAYKWVVLGALTLAHLATSNAALSIQPLAPFLLEDLHLRNVQVGMMTSSFYLGALVLSIPLGWVVDRFGVHRVFVASQVVVGAFILAVSRAHAFGAVLLCLVLAGIGYSGINPATGKAIMVWFPWRGRATAMSVKQTGIPLGGALAAVTLPALAQAYSWRASFVASGCAALCVGILSAFVYRESPGTGEASPTATFVYRRWTRMLDIFRNRDLVLLNAVVMLYLALQMVLMTYLVLFARDALGRSVLVAGALLSLAHVGGVLGRLSWGVLSDYLFGGRRKAVLVLNGVLSGVMCLACAFLGPGSPSWLLLPVVFVFGFSAIGWNGLYLTFVGELSGKDEAGAATGASLSIIYLGVLFGPPLFGFAIDRTGSYSLPWGIAAAVVAGAALLIGLVREKDGLRGGTE